MDLFIFNLINSLAEKWSWLDCVGVFLAKYFEYVLILAVLLVLAKNIRKNIPLVIVSFGSAIVSRFVLCNFIRMIWFRERPFVSGIGTLLLNDYDPNKASFPSGHASFYFALSTVLFLCNKKLGIFSYIASFLIVISRVYVGVHWPSDILAGAVLGIITGLISYNLFKRYFHKELPIVEEREI